jgi:hypothetical protein
MANQRKRIGPLDTAGSVAIENAKVYKELRRGRIEPSLASRLSQILINQRVILEAWDAQKRIEQLEALLEAAGRGPRLRACRALPSREQFHDLVGSWSCLRMGCYDLLSAVLRD